MSTAWIVALTLVAGGGAKGAVTPLPTPPAPGGDVWKMTLPEAIRIGVRNSEVVRVVAEPKSGEAGMTIAQANRDASAGNFQSALMAHVRSVEQQYWALFYIQVEVWARETAVKLCEEVVRAEENDLGNRGQAADVAEAKQALERCRGALAKATAEATTVERGLRNILGLPAIDGRRIVPVTAPTVAKVEPNWQRSLAAMMENQPDVRQQRELASSAEAEERALRDACKALPPSDLGRQSIAGKAAEEAKALAGRQREFSRKVILQATNTLARFTLEIDGSYREFRQARRRREAAQAVLDGARAAYEEGRTGFTNDRLFAAIAAYADAVAGEAEALCTYNTAVAALDEAKGTILADCKIAVVDPPGRATAAKATASAASPPWWVDRGIHLMRPLAVDRDAQVKPAAHAAPAEAPKPAGPKAAESGPTPPPARVIKYDITIEGGPLPIGLKGTVSIGGATGRR